MIRRREILALPLLGVVPRAIAQNFHCGILVVGAGGAGLAAALEASACSDSVVLIEKESFIGGDTLYSGGFFNAPNTEFQNRKGIKDSEEFYLQQITRSANGRGNPKVQTKLAKEAANTLNWLRKNGVTFGDEIYQIYGSGYRRSHKPVTALGSSYVQNLAAACLKNGVSIRTSTRLESFEVLPNQRGFRVTISSKGVSSVITSRALILCAGGFANNPELIRRYVPNLNFKYSYSRGTGEVLQRAIEAGVQVENMDAVECIPEGSILSKYSARLYAMAPGTVFINEDGERFVDEAATRKTISEALIKQGAKRCWTIVDIRSVKRLDKSQQKNLYRAYFAGQVWKNDTLEALCKDINVPFEKVKVSFEQVDPRHRPSVAPFWAVRMYPWIHYTLGGISINEQAECLNKFGIPIPGLYAAGQITGSVHGENRLGGNGLTDAFTFGRIAGKNAARWIKEN